MPSTSSSVRDTDRGFRRIVKMLTRDAKRARVDVGWFEKSKHEDGTSTAEIATHHEYGAPKANIPERSMLRATVDAHRLEYKRLHDDAWGRAIDGSESIEKALLRFGHRIRTDVVLRITKGIPPGIKHASGNREAGSKALIESGVMRDQIDVRVKTGTAAGL